MDAARTPGELRDLDSEGPPCVTAHHPREVHFDSRNRLSVHAGRRVDLKRSAVLHSDDRR
jgi:hypothetical protein